MEIYRVKALLDIRSGERQDGTKWQSRDVVLETFGKRNDESVVAGLFGADVDKFQFKPGDTVRVQLRHSAREYQGKWYNDIAVWDYEQDNRPF